MIAGIVKAFGFTPEYVLYEMSFANAMMYSAVLPSYDFSKDRKKGNDEDDEVIDADDPANKQRITELLNAYE